MQLNKGETIVAYSNRIVDLISELESAVHNISELENKLTLLRGLPKDFEVKAETLLVKKYNPYKAVSRIIVRETRLHDSQIVEGKALLTHKKSEEVEEVLLHAARWEKKPEVSGINGIKKARSKNLRTEK